MKKVSFVFLIIVIIIGIFFYIKNTNLLPENHSEEIQLGRQEIMQDIAEKIADISPAEPVLGGSWFVSRFWFVKENNENFYVEYEDGHILRRILLKAEKKGNKIDYELIGYFEPGETTWLLKQGQDPFFGKNLDLYEYNQESKLWLKKN